MSNTALKCSECSWCWKDIEDSYPRCQYKGSDPAPCELDDDIQEPEDYPEL